MFIKELKKFSHENWWVYIMLVIILGLIYYTGKGSIIEVLLLFIANFLGNVFVMVAMGNYAIKKNKVGSLYHLSSTLTFTALSIYGLLFLSQYQYIIWQIAFLFGAFKAFFFYYFGKELKFINEYTLVVLNIILLSVFFAYFSPILFSVLQALGFAFVTTGLVSIRDSFRYSFNLLGTFFIISGSFVGVYQSYEAGNIDGIALGYLLLTATACVYFLKLLPSYIKKLKK